MHKIGCVRASNEYSTQTGSADAVWSQILAHLWTTGLERYSFKVSFGSKWWAWLDSNQRPKNYEFSALTN